MFILELHNKIILVRIAYILTYHSRFNPERVAEASHIPPRLPHFSKITYEEYCRRDMW
jgi:hypothetical protein